MNDGDKYLEVRIDERVDEAEGIVSFTLVHPDGKEMPPFTAGSHVDVHPVGGPSRSYSLCNDPRDSNRYQIAVLREPNSRGGSQTMHDRVLHGDKLRISFPRNLFELDESASYSLLLAGGIGITPILAMAERLFAIGKPFELHYFTRSASRAAFRRRLGESNFANFVHLHFDDEPSTKIDISDLIENAPPLAHLYVCGPAGFLDAVLDSGHRAGWSDSRLHWERFGAAPVSADQLATAAAFELVLDKSKKTFNIPSGKTIIEVLAANGVEIPTSCEQGVCGTCLTKVLAGVPDHRDMYLTPEEQHTNDQFLPCCSRSKTAQLVIDL